MEIPTMNKLLLFWAFVFIIASCEQSTSSANASNQKNTLSKVKVYLLGSFHFALTDSTYNVLDADHQKSIAELCNIIVAQNPEKVFIERQPEYESRSKLDSVFRMFKNGAELTRPSEAYQIGFRVAKMLNHSKVYQCDHPGRFGYLSRATIEYADSNGQMDILSGHRFGTVKRHDELINEDSIMNNSSLLDYTRWLNSEEVMRTSHENYIATYPLVGSTNFYDYDDDYTLIGADVLTDWYRRNILIYSKMINQVDYKKDKAIFLVIGGDHVPILNELFTANPFFEVVETDSWLN